MASRLYKRMSNLLAIIAKMTANDPHTSYTSLPVSQMELSVPVTASLSSMTEPKWQENDQILYLNGLRGVSCLAVYIWHFSWPYQPHLFFAYGMGAENTSIMQLPFVRLVYAGDAMVRVFFVLSGFVLSLGPLRAAKDGGTAKVASKVASLGIRRGFRLFIPPIVVSLFTLLATCLGWLDNLPPSTPPPTHSQQHARVPHHEPSLWLQTADWLRWVVRSLVNPWPASPDTPASQYGPQFWTIPHEFRCSMTVFLLLVILEPVRSRLRVLVVVVLSVYCMLLDREQEELSLFLAGMVLADLDIWRKEEPNMKRKHRLLLESVISWFFMVFGLYLLSWPPNKGYLSPAYRFLSLIDKQHNHWHNVGAVMLFYAVLRVRLVQQILSLRPVLYLGRISYALYCVHYLIILVAGSRLLAFFWACTGTESWIQEQGGFLLALGLTTVAVIMASEAFYRVVDSGAIRLARFMENFLTS